MVRKYKEGDIIKEIFDKEDMIGPMSLEGDMWFEVIGLGLTRETGDTLMYVIQTVTRKADGTSVMYNVEIAYLEENTELVTEAEWVLNGPTDR